MDRLIREALKDLTPYTVTGRDGYLLLDANESPEELPDCVVAAVVSQLKTVNRYPREGDKLKLKLAEFLGYGISKDNLVLTNGGDGGIGLIVSTFINPGDCFLTVEPTFSMYKFYCSLSGGLHEGLNYLAEFSYPFKQVRERLLEPKPPKLLFICSPNNPTGGALPLAELEAVMECAKNTVVVVDQAYIEFGGDSALPLLSKCPNLIVLRTFSKALGLAGLRIGYCIAQRGTIALLKRALPPFLVSSLALALGEAILDNRSHAADRVKEIVAQRNLVLKALSAMPGIKVYPSKGNFFFMEADDPHLGSRLKEKGILVRDIAHGQLRVTIGNSRENRRLLEEIGNG